MTKYDGVPELSLADYTNEDSRAEFCEQLFDGLKYYGFIILRDHGIPELLLDVAYDLTGEFFALGETEKLAYSHKEMFYQRGYVPFGQEHAKGNIYPDLKEMWHQGREYTALHPQSRDYPKNVVPTNPEGFHDVLNDLYNELDRVGQQVLEALTPSFDLPENYFHDLASGGNSLLRALHYPPLADDVDPHCVRSAAHEDINLITLLIAASTAGLELLDRDGTWLPVHGSRNSIVVDAGDMLARITNNVISATTHRVVNPEGENVSRYSMPFFLHPKSDAVLSCIDSCRDGTEQPDIRADDFLKERLRDIGVAV
jgi:isopenicillin N synthase-like dioxygenase